MLAKIIKSRGEIPMFTTESKEGLSRCNLIKYIMAIMPTAPHLEYGIVPIYRQQRLRLFRNFT